MGGIKPPFPKHKQMKLVNDFFNKVAKAIDTKYYPEIKYYRDNKNTTKIHYTLELFSNGCLTYKVLINRLAKACKDTKENIHAIVKEFIHDFEGYEYKIK